MKLLLVAEYREGKILDTYGELLGFAQKLNAESSMVLVGAADSLPSFDGKLYLADVATHGESNADVHKQVVLDVVSRENPDMVVLCHSSYGWDLAPRIAYQLKAAQVSEVVDIQDGKLVVPVCNAKLRRTLVPGSALTVATIQSGAFAAPELAGAAPRVESIEVSTDGSYTFLGYEEATEGGVDLTKADIIVSAGRGVGKADNVGLVIDLAKALGGEYAASRPVVDSEWVAHERQVGTTGQTVAPKLYIACGISGAIQHLAGMKKSDFIVAINTDRDAPIAEEADALVIADLLQFVPILTEKIQSL
ncbi:electron transfer flavoprotein subunit alpha/FixB family protein [Desulforhopalus singaporensis]|uniref:Electron transfer flavoprotein alpha subunit apoprotein n=1 Tax=Desulforhopalus singaporensis TaxID=91360 RepID=A0A1H0P069_9BACT|nr:electron transfer flavoprotein subunit alpha/FixB family protein [Desulforhopalus singaporensis]SDO98311.1 electron transfer flavoprotein alpha subunit apoprotein [Desulforhopalus singaporensis]